MAPRYSEMRDENRRWINFLQVLKNIMERATITGRELKVLEGFLISLLDKHPDNQMARS
ncbi:MAG: hypothetical protein ACTSRA_01240 [Promethearchaeota archaeon]